MKTDRHSDDVLCSAGSALQPQVQRYNLRSSPYFERKDYNRNRRSKKVHVNYFRPNYFFVALKGVIVARERLKMENFGIDIRKEHRISLLIYLYAVIQNCPGREEYVGHFV